jgi:hypothetical protein
MQYRRFTTIGCDEATSAGTCPVPSPRVPYIDLNLLGDHFIDGEAGARCDEFRTKGDQPLRSPFFAMSLDPNPSRNLTGTRPSSPARAPRADFRGLAKRIAGRTTDLIAIGVVLVGGLTLGRQVLEWWRTDPPETVAATNALPGTAGPWGAANTPVQLEFGEYPLALRRETIAGDREAAMTALVSACRAAVQAEPKNCFCERLSSNQSRKNTIAGRCIAWRTAFRWSSGFGRMGTKAGLRMPDRHGIWYAGG